MNMDRIGKAYRAWSRYRKSYNELNRLSDRDLWDIGVNRGDIPALSKAYALK